MVRVGNNAVHTMLTTKDTHTFLVEAAPAAATPSAQMLIDGRRSNEVLALAGRYAS
jgi:hypothetical protein